MAGQSAMGKWYNANFFFVLPKRTDVWLNDENPRYGGLIPVLIMVAGNKVHLLALDVSSEVSGIGGRHFERVVAKDVQLVFGLDLFVDVGDKRIVHFANAAKRPVRKIEDTLVPEVGV